MLTLLFVLFAGLAIGCGIAMVAQRIPLYSAISLVGVFIALASLYITLAAPFIAAVQIIVYAGAIMVLVIFVIMLLNVEEEARRPLRLRYLVPTGVVLAALLIAEAAFMLYFVGASATEPVSPGRAGVGLTASIGTGLFTEYLLPFEITSVLILMAIVGAMTLAQRETRRPQAVNTAATTQTSQTESLKEARATVTPTQTEVIGREYAKNQVERLDSDSKLPGE